MPHCVNVWSVCNYRTLHPIAARRHTHTGRGLRFAGHEPPPLFSQFTELTSFFWESALCLHFRPAVCSVHPVFLPPPAPDWLQHFPSWQQQMSYDSDLLGSPVSGSQPIVRVPHARYESHSLENAVSCITIYYIRSIDQGVICWYKRCSHLVDVVRKWEKVGNPLYVCVGSIVVWYRQTYHLEFLPPTVRHPPASPESWHLRRSNIF